MADRGDRPIRTGPERIRKLAQAALNADVTVEQVDTILEGLSETLEDLNHSTGNLDATLERFNETINQINELAPRLHDVVDRMEGVVARVERIVEMGESVISPLAATEQVRLCAAAAQRAISNRLLPCLSGTSWSSIGRHSRRERDST